MNYFSTNTLWHAAPVSGTELVQWIETWLSLCYLPACELSLFQLKLALVWMRGLRRCQGAGRALAEDEQGPEGLRECWRQTPWVSTIFYVMREKEKIKTRVLPVMAALCLCLSAFILLIACVWRQWNPPGLCKESLQPLPSTGVRF